MGRVRQQKLRCVDVGLPLSGSEGSAQRGGAIIFTSVLRINDLITLAKNTSLYYKTTGIWHKTNPMPRNMKYHFVSSIEPWLYFVNDKRTGTFNNNGKAIHDHIDCAVASKRERTQGTHPTQKPENLLTQFITLLSNEGDTVLDPFMGSGSTGVVCKRENRNFIGIELDENYYNLAQRRIERE